MADEFPVVVTADQLRFEIRLALMEIPASLWRQWALGKVLRSEQAREMIVASIQGRLSRFQVRERAPVASPISGIGNTR